MTINGLGLWLRWRGWFIGGVASVAMVLLWFLVYWDRRANEELGRWKAIGQRLQRDSALAANTVRRTDSVFTTDTIRLTRAVTRYERIRDSVLVRLTDTLTVERFVTVADSTVRACLATVDSCTQRVAARDSLLAIVGQQGAADRRLFEARLRARSPLLTPYAEALVDPMDSRTLVARAGLAMRFLGPVSLSAALQYTSTQEHRLRPLVGVRVRF